MRRWVWIVVALVVAVGVGGYSYTRYRLQEEAYTNQIQTGKQALQDRNYSVAETNFTHATRTKVNDTVAQRYLTQTQTYVSGTKALKSRQFTEAQRDFTTVKNTDKGASALISQAKAQLTLITKVKSNRQDYQKQYQQALTLNKANDFTDSNGVIMVMLQDKTFKDSYYKDIYNQALSLRKQNNASLKALTGSTPTITNAAQSANTPNSSTQQRPAVASGSSSANASSSSTSSTAGSLATNGLTATTTSGAATNAQIQATRAELTEQGLNGSNYSDDQIQAILTRANNEHISIAQAAKTGSYSADQIQATRTELSQAGFSSSRYTDAQIQAILQRANTQHLSIAQAAKSMQ
ncbi:hypothetical protein [Lactiplantibacillus herbarum]|uniref:hypothetical protein n=1 Tax=Lactiplantibacillus herbarum TaxID=1670446 RepID=UPI00064E2B35|nr:hypothetical protein [Lactiplantibacillus herbarum]